MCVARSRREIKENTTTNSLFLCKSLGLERNLSAKGKKKRERRTRSNRHKNERRTARRRGACVRAKIGTYLFCFFLYSNSFASSKRKGERGGGWREKRVHFFAILLSWKKKCPLRLIFPFLCKKRGGTFLPFFSSLKVWSLSLSSPVLFNIIYRLFLLSDLFSLSLFSKTTDHRYRERERGGNEYHRRRRRRRWR